MATHKLPEMEPESLFLSLPATLTSHLVLPVEWPETGLTTSMVSHQIYQPCTEYFEETIPAGACSPQLDQQDAKEDTLEENLREDLKDWLTGIDFKATYGNYEEDSLEATLAEDLPGNIAMANEAPIAVHQMEHEVVEENVEEVDKKADTGDIDYKLPEEEEETVEVLDMAAEISMAAHKLSDIEPMSEFQSLSGSLASHLVLPVEWPETGLSTSMVAHQIYQPSHKKLEETISQMPSLEHEASMDQHGVEEKCAVDLEENLRIYFKEQSKDVDFKATYCHIEAEAEDPILNQRDSLDIRQSEDTPELVQSNPIEEDDSEETTLIESGLSCSMVGQSLNLLVMEATKPEKEAETCTSMVATTTMVGHQVVEAEESGHPYTSMAAHCSLVPEWKEEGIVSSGVSHQLLNHSMREEDQKCEENLPEIEESVTTEKPSKGDVREDEVRQILKAEKDPRRSIEELALTSVGPKSPVVGPSDDEKDSFENFINESKQTYHERVADEYKSTIKRIQDLHKLVEEEIGEFEKSRKDVIMKSEVVTVMSNVKGVSFPLEITINQKNEKEESLLEKEETQKEEGIRETIMESETEEEDCANIISASCTLRENTPILITTNMDQQVECDSGFESSPDLKKTENGVRSLQVSFAEREAESPVSFPRQTLTKRSSEEKKTRDKQLLESFLKNENHQQIKDKTTVTNNSGSSVSPEKKQMPKIPHIPIAQESGEVKKQKKRKPKVTTTAFKDSIMKKTYKIRFHVNLKESEAQKPRSVLQTFLSFFKDHSMFGKK